MSIIEDFKEIPKQYLLDILRQRCNILSNPQQGKSNLSKVIVAEMVRQELPVHVKIFDTAQNFRHDFLSSFKFQEINKETRQVYKGIENVLYDLEFTDSEEIMQFVGNDVLLTYEENRAKKKFAGKLDEWTLYVIEEAQNSLGRYSLSRSTGRIWMKMISEAANFGIAFLFIGQRAADISTSVIERSTCHWIGKTTGDNNTKKLKGIIGSEAGKEKLGMPIHEVAKTLGIGEFIYWNGKDCLLFQSPLFSELYLNEKPIEVKPPTPRWMKLF